MFPLSVLSDPNGSWMNVGADSSFQLIFYCIVLFMKYYLHMDGRGNYEFKPITEETVEFGS